MEDAPIMVGGRESCSTCVTGSGSRRMISEGNGSALFLGDLGGSGGLVGEGDGDVAGEFEKDLLLIVVFGVEGGEVIEDRGDWGGEVKFLDFSGDMSVLGDEGLGEV